MAVVYSLPPAREGFAWQLITLQTRDANMILPQLRASTGGCFVDILNWTEATVVMALTTHDRICLLGQFPTDRPALDELLQLARRQATGILKEWLPALTWTVGYQTEPADEPARLQELVTRLNTTRQPEDCLWHSRLLKATPAGA